MKLPATVVALVSLLWGAGPAAAQPASRPVAKIKSREAGLSLKVRAWFKKEQRGDGAPTLHFRYILRNHTDRPIYLNNYGRAVRLASLSPRRAFQVSKHHRKPHRMRPPRKEDIVTVAPRSTRVLRDWQWCCGFELPHAHPAFVARYQLKRPARVTLRFCLTGGSSDRLARHLPGGKTFWTGRLCTRPVRVRLLATGP